MNDISQAILTPVVSRVLDDVNVDLTRWSVHPISYPSVSPHSRGLFRVHGNANTPSGAREWSLVLKTIQRADDSATSDPAHPFYWKREAHFYLSHFLPRDSNGFAAPACFGATEPSDTSVWLWLEAITEPDPTPWTMTRFARAATHVGRFSGTKSDAAALPVVPWFSRGLLRAWVADSAELIASVQDTTIWNHPLLRDTAFPTFVPALLQLWEERDAWFTVLEQLPQTLCHHDMWRKNLLGRGTGGASDQTVAIDWELVGFGAVGEDLGNLIGVSLLNFDIDAQDAHLFAATMLDNYAHGLEDAQWRDDMRMMRAAVQATAALRCVFSTACWPAAIVHNPDTQAQFIHESEQRWGRPITAIFAQWATVTDFLLEQIAEARAIVQP